MTEEQVRGLEPEGGRKTIRLDEVRGRARDVEAAQGFTFSELRDHADDEDWLDNHPGAREKMADLSAAVGNLTKLPQVMMKGLGATAKGLEAQSPPQTDLSLLIAEDPTHKTNDLLELQIDALQGLVLAQDNELRFLEAEATRNNSRAKSQTNQNRWILGVAILTLVVAIASLIVAMGSS